MAERVVGASGVIETVYRGTRFRSRLEARWAVVFDHLGMEWKYEAEGYTANGANYLPDFYFPASNTWAEIKGSIEMLRNDAARLRSVLGDNSPLPGFRGCHRSELEDGVSAGVILLGDVPATHHMVAHPVLQHSIELGPVRAWGAFVPLLDVDSNIERWRFCGFGPQSVLLSLMRLGVAGGKELVPDGAAWTLDPRQLIGSPFFPKLENAYSAGRNARFEHGVRGR